MWSLLSVWSELIDRTKSGPWKPYAGPDFERGLGLLGLSFLACLVLLGSGAGVWFWGRQTPVPAHYLVQADGSTVGISVVKTPSVWLKKVERWSMTAVRDVFTMNFFNAQERVERARPNFTDAGWEYFQAALNSNDVLKEIQSKQLDVTVVPLKTARVINQQSFANLDVWEVQIPLLVAYTGSSRPVYRRMICTLQIQQVDPTENIEGMAIAKIFLTPYG